MKLHQNKQLFQEAVIAASQRFDIPQLYIEKDYWVTLALYEIFHSAIASEAVFKGGTALAKCLKLIERFSEDIDIVVLRKAGERDNQLKKKIKTITNVVAKVMPEIEIEGITNKMGKIRKTANEYNKAGFAGNFGQVRNFVVVEAAWLGSYEPFTNEVVSCYIAELFQDTKQEALIKEYKR